MREEWRIDSRGELWELANTYHKPVSRWPSVQAVVDALRAGIRQALRAYEHAEAAYSAHLGIVYRIREAFAIHEKASTPFDLYYQRNNSPIIGWRPHPFSARLEMAVTSTAMPPPPKCDICDQIQTAACHVAAANEKPA